MLTIVQTLAPFDAPRPGDRYRMRLAALPTDRQPDGIHVVDRVDEEFVYWAAGGRTLLALVVPTCGGAYFVRVPDEGPPLGSAA